jgi:hypothetical protein
VAAAARGAETMTTTSDELAKALKEVLSTRGRPGRTEYTMASAYNEASEVHRAAVAALAAYERDKAQPSERAFWYDTPRGLALTCDSLGYYLERDGRVVFGPFQDEGSLAACDSAKTKPSDALLKQADAITDTRGEVMAQWDSWRTYIAGGGTASWPRDAFEALMDYHAELLRDAAYRIPVAGDKAQPSKSAIAAVQECLDGKRPWGGTRDAIASALSAARAEGLEQAAKIVDQCNREGPYNAIGAASRIRALIKCA